jgi:hypothetical protein
MIDAATMRGMRARWSRARALLLAALPLGCGHGGTPAAETPAKGIGHPEITMGPGALQDGDEVLAAWILYGAAKAKQYDDHPPPSANASADDFALELGAREAQSAFWAERREKGAPAHAALDRQVEIWRAGFLPELVVAVHAVPGWTVPPAAVTSLRLEEFVHRFPGSYTPGAPVSLKTPSGKVAPDVPGADFPDPQALPVGPESCTHDTALRAQAWRRWDALVPSLGGAPVAATTTLDFGRQLIAIRREPEGYPRGATWVSARVAHLALVDGFCAVEARDWPLAVRTLARAESLDPSNPSPHLELALALTMVKRHAEGLRQADLALAAAHDGCTAAQGWRRRGYILFELGALEDARRAYEKSLTIDPGNSIAENELRAIAAAQKQQGESNVHQPFEAPPSGGIVISKCRPADGAGETR